MIPSLCLHNTFRMLVNPRRHFPYTLKRPSYKSKGPNFTEFALQVLLFINILLVTFLLLSCLFLWVVIELFLIISIIFYMLLLKFYADAKSNHIRYVQIRPV